MRISQLSDFCDGTQIFVLNALHDRLTQEAFATENRFQIESSIIKYVLEQISTKLQERMKIRRVEIAFGLRKKTVTAWDEYIQLSKSHPELWTTHTF